MTYLIGLDIDGVCYHYDRTARYMLRRKLEDEGREIPWQLREPSEDWDTVSNAIDPADFEWLYAEGVHRGLFRYGHVVSGAIEGVQSLNEFGDVIAITTRPKLAVHDTMVWLSTMFDKAPLAGINILSHGQKKSAVRPQPNIYVDDATHNIEDIIENTPDYVRVVLFGQPWNTKFEGFDDPKKDKRWKRSEGWRDTVDLVRAAKAQKW